LLNLLFQTADSTRTFATGKIGGVLRNKSLLQETFGCLSSEPKFWNVAERRIRRRFRNGVQTLCGDFESDRMANCPTRLHSRTCISIIKNLESLFHISMRYVYWKVCIELCRKRKSHADFLKASFPFFPDLQHHMFSFILKERFCWNIYKFSQILKIIMLEHQNNYIERK